jgi:hypothetical protein
MQNLIYLIAGAVLICIGYIIGRTSLREPTKNEGSFFMSLPSLPSLPKADDAPKKQPEKKDTSNKFYK